MYKIAISGKLNSGKNTIGKMIVKELKNSATIDKVNYMAFADPIKKMASIMFPNIPRKFLYGSSKYRIKIIENYDQLTIRQLLIDLGTSGRKYNPDIWIDCFNNQFKKINEENNIVTIVNDCRFRNEFEYLKNNKFYKIRIYRKSNLLKIDSVTETNQDSILDDEFDYIIYNNGSLKELKLEISKFVKNYLSK